MMRGLSIVFLAALAIVTTGPPVGAAIFETTFDSAVMLGLNPSARAQAMGGASGAVFWGDLDGWSNPAVLGLVRGLRYEQESSDMPFGLGYEARRAGLGWGGVGLALAGRPFAGMGGLRLSGDLTIEAAGVPPLSFQFKEEVKSWAVGASLSQLAASIARLRGSQPPTFTRLGDLALGFSHKDYRPGIDSVGSATAMDWGVLVRTGSAFTAYATQCRIEVAYGYSVQNANEVDLSGLGRAARPHRHGTAVRLSLDPPAMSQRRTSLGLHPLLELGGTWDRVFVTSGGRRVGDETRLGAEVGLANVAFVRFGQGSGDNVSTWGYGFALPIGNFARARYDHARIPIEGFSDTTVDGWSLWCDVLAVAEAWQQD
jgi:hypothetical protein